MDQIAGSVAILTGASRGLGVSIARELAANGVNLALAARSADDLDGVRNQVVGMGVKAISVPCDVTVADQRTELLERASSELGPVDILVNNAGVETIAAYAAIDPAEIEHTIDVNLRSPMVLTRTLLPQLLARGRGHVVNIASAAGKSGTPYGAPYSATKFGLVGMTQALRAEHSGSSVGFSVICPGFVRDEGMYARMEAEGIKASWLIGSTTPEKVARAVVKAIVRDKPEIIVNTPPLRAVVVLESAFPSVHEWIMNAFGVTRTFGKTARSRGLG